VDFDWDDGNRDKNLRHGVHDWEIEEAFADPNRRFLGRTRESAESRYQILGRSPTSGSYLRIVYTIRVRAGVELIRPISAVRMSQAERRTYRR
jgi:uncharacterized DUF497 family protein